MIGLVCDLVFFRVPDRPHIRGLNWRLMLASVRIRILRCALLITGQIRLAYPPSSFLFKCCSVPSLRDGMYPKDVTTRPFSPCCGYAIIPSKPLAIFIVCAATNIIVDKLRYARFAGSRKIDTEKQDAILRTVHGPAESSRNPSIFHCYVHVRCSNFPYFYLIFL